MKKNNILMFALLGAMACVSCQEAFEIEEKQQPVEPAKQWTLTVQATKGVETKALNLVQTQGQNDVLDAYWMNGEKVDVYLDGTYKATLAVSAPSGGSKDATLTASLSSLSGIENGATLTLLFPGREDHAWNYAGQDGSAPDETGSLATQYDYALATVTATVEGSTITTTHADFQNQQNLYRFGFKKKADNVATDYTIPVNVDHFVVSATNLVASRTFSNGSWTSKKEDITVTPAYPTSELLYVALRIEQATAADEEFLFKVFGPNSDYYEGTQTIPAGYLTNGKFISAKGVKVDQLQLSTQNAAPATTF